MSFDLVLKDQTIYHSLSHDSIVDEYSWRIVSDSLAWKDFHFTPNINIECFAIKLPKPFVFDLFSNKEKDKCTEQKERERERERERDYSSFFAFDLSLFASFV